MSNVIEYTAPPLSAWTHVSAGDGLIGADGSWATLADTPAKSAFAARNLLLIRLFQQATRCWG
jgi:hypothetical protein